MLHILGDSNSILNTFISELRDATIQKDSLRFRRNIERIGEIMAYEISKTLSYESKSVTTQLGTANINLPTQQPVIAAVLRAGLPLHQGFLNYFDRCENAFVSAYRKYTSENDFDVHVEYMASASVNNKVLILCDPLLATGTSMVLAHQALLKNGQPTHTHIVSVIASKKGVDYVQKHLPNATFWCCAVDEELNAHAYIVPGLGDAGDLCYGEKM